MAWTDEKKEQVIAEYQSIMQNEHETDEARANATVEVVKELADKYDETVNGTRSILNRAGVYIKKAPAAKSSSSGSSGGTKRVNKAEAQQELKNLISAIDPELVDDEIISKLTGKAAVYFSGILAVKD